MIKIPSRVLALILCACFSVVTVFLIENHRKGSQIDRGDDTCQKVVTALNINHEAELSLTGRKLEFTPGLELINEPSAQVNIPPSDEYLLLYIDEKSCNVCADEESRNLQSIATRFGFEKCIAVVHTATRRNAINYVRLNNLSLPVLLDGDNSFFRENNISASPIILLVKDGVIQMAHIPLAGHIELCQPFHTYTLNLFSAKAPNDQPSSE